MEILKTNLKLMLKIEERPLKLFRHGGEMSLIDTKMQFKKLPKFNQFGKVIG